MSSVEPSVIPLVLGSVVDPVPLEPLEPATAPPTAEESGLHASAAMANAEIESPRPIARHDTTRADQGDARNRGLAVRDP
ncbi:MAG: hypothetical protein AAF799_05955 [Myxococcota bacterium]